MRAAELDAADPLAQFGAEFLPAEGVSAYLDGNSLGRPLRASAERVQELINGAWGTGLIRSWDEQWMAEPLRLGDELGRVVLGAGPGQTMIGDSTTVLLYKWLRAAVALDPRRSRIVLDTENFPTDRYLAAAVARETGAELVWLRPDPAAGVSPEQVADAVDGRTAVVLLSHVAYKSAWLADLPAITAIAHEAGALVLWDLCHSAGVVGVALDAADVDLAVGCSYKFLNGGPGAPAFGYVAARLQDRLEQPITGWMGHADPFAMGPDYRPATGMRRFVSGTPPILGMAPIADMIRLIERAGLPAIREKSIKLGEYVIAEVDARLAGLGVRVASPRDPERRGAHVTLAHPAFREIYRALWGEGVIPDFREPDGIRLGLSPLSTSFAEVEAALDAIERQLR
ncbi:kynureninase [Naumannella cuiyingiana]|uniref:Kynureninase n=1 Tax=Naumannella cuiyingiana TaxID=1347891 RepID=A0A7Z0D7M4_9ACTN|nr:kynureninase [Naumannella cuiyingiana]